MGAMKVCKVCGKQLVGLGFKGCRLYCSNECKDSTLKTNNRVNCVICGKESTLCSKTEMLLRGPYVCRACIRKAVYKSIGYYNGFHGMQKKPKESPRKSKGKRGRDNG